MNNKQIIIDYISRAELDKVIDLFLKEIPSIKDKTLLSKLVLVCFEFFSLKEQVENDEITSETAFVKKRKLINKILFLVL